MICDRGSCLLIIFSALLFVGCQSPEPAAPAAAAPRDQPSLRVANAARPVQPSAQPAPNPLAGTRWIVRSIIGAGYVSTAITIEFESNGRFVMTTIHEAGTSDVDERRYVVDGNRLLVRDAIGGETAATFRRFGNELTIDGPRARVTLRQSGGAEEVIGVVETHERDAGALPDAADHALRGTTWSIVSTMGNVPLSYTGGTFEFRRNGRLIMDLERSDGTTNVVERRYRVSGMKVVLLDPLGMSIPMTITRLDERLVLDLPSARISLKRRGD